MDNANSQTIEGFGKEWSQLDQSGLAEDYREKMFDSYFSIFPWD